MSADGATLKLTNQENGWKNVCVHQQKNSKPRICPVKALARVVNDMMLFTKEEGGRVAYGGTISR